MGVMRRRRLVAANWRSPLIYPEGRRNFAMGSFAKEKCGGRQSAATQRTAIDPSSLTYYTPGLPVSRLAGILPAGLYYAR